MSTLRQICSQLVSKGLSTEGDRNELAIRLHEAQEREKAQGAGTYEETQGLGLSSSSEEEEEYTDETFQEEDTPGGSGLGDSQGGGEAQLSHYELVRRKKIAENEAFMIQCGLQSAVKEHKKQVVGVGRKNADSKKRGRKGYDSESYESESNSEDSEDDYKESQLAPDEDWPEEDFSLSDGDLCPESPILNQCSPIGDLFAKELGKAKGKQMKVKSNTTRPKKWKPGALPSSPPRVMEMGWGSTKSTSNKSSTAAPSEMRGEDAIVNYREPGPFDLSSKLSKPKKEEVLKKRVFSSSAIGWNEVKRNDVKRIVSEEPAIFEVPQKTSFQIPIVVKSEYETVSPGVVRGLEASLGLKKIKHKSEDPIGTCIVKQDQQAAVEVTGIPKENAVTSKSATPVGRSYEASQSLSWQDQSVAAPSLPILIAADLVGGTEKENSLVKRPSKIVLPETASQHPLTIGRSSASRVDVCLDSPEKFISRHHANIIRNPKTGTFIVVDLKSTNGIFANGVKVMRKPLRNGDHISFGAICPCPGCKPKNSSAHLTDRAPFVYVVSMG